MSLLVAILTWGTIVGLGVLAFAFATHVFSAVEAIRRNSFPGFGRLVPSLTASAGLGVACYAPALAMASVYAWPIVIDDRPREGYLVNRWAYRHEGPVPGETVWLGAKPGGRSKVARIIANAGQRVEWAGHVFRVDDQVVEDRPIPQTEALAELKLTVPEGHVLVVYPLNPRQTGGPTDGWEIVERKEIRGRAWARSYPIWDRGLLR
jgi:hypothetical protein